MFFAGLSFYTTESGLSETFSQYGQVVEAKIVMDRFSDRSKGFGFVTYASQDEAEKALDEMNGKTLNGRVIFVDYAKPKINFGGGVPIARGPPEPTSESMLACSEKIQNGANENSCSSLLFKATLGVWYQAEKPSEQSAGGTEPPLPPSIASSSSPSAAAAKTSLSHRRVLFSKSQPIHRLQPSIPFSSVFVTVAAVHLAADRRRTATCNRRQPHPFLGKARVGAQKDESSSDLFPPILCRQSPPC
ncbi:hypothetical protein Tsubulata_001325 [Turnera subulata]|uniref:RRM domain-containing protein n=1 Tax=Turnera subulata TaxID=218843 RepID=A0A9Q0J6H2_9ROSI|nr:hypothetical protein Tsubulata_001325 [Turnera subulata]